MPPQVRLVKELLPGQPVGYVVMNETAAARTAGMHRLLRIAEAEVVALHYAMASQGVTAVGACATENPPKPHPPALAPNLPPACSRSSETAAHPLFSSASGPPVASAVPGCGAHVLGSLRGCRSQRGASVAPPPAPQRAHAARKRVHAWTANTAGMMRTVLDAGVDAVVTNHPQRWASLQSFRAWLRRVLRCQLHHRLQASPAPCFGAPAMLPSTRRTSPGPCRLADAIQSRLRRCAARDRQRQGGLGLDQQGQAAGGAQDSIWEDRAQLRRLQQVSEGQQEQQQQSGRAQPRQSKAERPP